MGFLLDQTGGGGSLESAVPISTATYAVTVGHGGQAPTGMNRAGNDGGDSICCGADRNC